MSKIICFSRYSTPAQFESNVHYYELFSQTETKRDIASTLGSHIPALLRKHAIVPSAPVLDFVAFALAVVAADKLIDRGSTVDGWTRKIDLTIHLHEAEKWSEQKESLEKMLRFLSGDFWELTFIPSGEPLIEMKYAHEQKAKSCVCLLSGGIDSLVGAVDLVSENTNPLFASQISRGDSEVQQHFANALSGASNHMQWSTGRLHGSESSTRARSIMFFAGALLASCALPQNGKRIKIFVPENGFISINIPMNANRMGSLSTKTTHPVYMVAMQNLWNALSINAELLLPYQYKTKGEMIKECKNPDILHRLIFSSASCGKFRRHKLQHCGVCVPCLVRRASFLEAGLQDLTTKGYVYEGLKNADSRDVAAVAMAIKQIETYGIERHIKSGLSFAESNDRGMYVSVISRGMTELENLLRRHSVL